MGRHRIILSKKIPDTNLYAGDYYSNSENCTNLEVALSPSFGQQDFLYGKKCENLPPAAMPSQNGCQQHPIPFEVSRQLQRETQGPKECLIQWTRKADDQARPVTSQLRGPLEYLSHPHQQQVSHQAVNALLNNKRVDLFDIYHVSSQHHVHLHIASQPYIHLLVEYCQFRLFIHIKSFSFSLL